jgi:hypothetical protein
MIEIREIRIREIDVPPVPEWLMSPPTAIPAAAPVTFQVGVPIIDMPGCVQSHNSGNGNKELQEDDPNGLVTHCDASIPFYTPMDFEPERVIPTKPAAVPKYDKPETKTPEIPLEILPAQPQTVQIKEPVIEVPEPKPEIPWQEKYLPAPEAATTTAAIAVVATTSALLAKPLADILLKVIKPTVKKVITKIAKIRGKKPKILSLAERREEQRDRTQAIRALRKALKPKG